MLTGTLVDKKNVINQPNRTDKKTTRGSFIDEQYWGGAQLQRHLLWVAETSCGGSLVLGKVFFAEVEEGFFVVRKSKMSDLVGRLYALICFMARLAPPPSFHSCLSFTCWSWKKKEKRVKSQLVLEWCLIHSLSVN